MKPFRNAQRTNVRCYGKEPSGLMSAATASSWLRTSWDEIICVTPLFVNSSIVYWLSAGAVCMILAIQQMIEISRIAFVGDYLQCKCGFGTVPLAALLTATE